MFLLAALTVAVGAGNTIAMKQMANAVPSHMFFVKSVRCLRAARQRCEPRAAAGWWVWCSTLFVSVIARAAVVSGQWSVVGPT